VLPVQASHMETVLRLQTRQIVLCCCFGPQAQLSIRRIKFPTLDSTSILFEAVLFMSPGKYSKDNYFIRKYICYRSMLEQAIVHQREQSFTDQLLFGTNHSNQIISQG